MADGRLRPELKQSRTATHLLKQEGLKQSRTATHPSIPPSPPAVLHHHHDMGPLGSHHHHITTILESHPHTLGPWGWQLGAKYSGEVVNSAPPSATSTCSPFIGVCPSLTPHSPKHPLPVISVQCHTMPYKKPPPTKHTRNCVHN